MSASPVQRYSPNSNYITTATHRMSPSTTLNKNGFESRTVEKSSTYKSTSNYVSDTNIRASPLCMAPPNVKDVQPHQSHA
ncbi:hypothetical protein DOY81_010582 [Sarcophaga bullata]|nr:hypothetical protein DOY81_010582 [Sarcophaga bullata]